MQELDRITALEYRMSELERRQGSEILPAKVTYVYRKSSDPGIRGDRDDGTWLGRVDVEVEGIEVERLPFLTLRQGADKTFWLPTEGELGILFSPSGDFANGMFIPGIAYSDFPSLVPDGISLEKHLTVYRDGIEHEIDVGAHSDVLSVPGGGKIERLVGESSRKQEVNVISDVVGAGIRRQMESEILDRVLGNEVLLNLIAMNVIGAIFYPTGLTNLFNSAGTVMFVPMATPSVSPGLPAGTPTDSDGNVTGTPPADIDDVQIREERSKNPRTSSNVDLGLPPLPIESQISLELPEIDVVPLGSSVATHRVLAQIIEVGVTAETVRGSYSADIEGVIHIRFPSRDFS